ncbi:MAG: hypothetical protein R2800_09460 [Flavipsychrobacter sp.]
MTQDEKEQLAREYWASRFEYLAQAEITAPETIYYWNDEPPIINDETDRYFTTPTATTTNVGFRYRITAVRR